MLILIIFIVLLAIGIGLSMFGDKLVDKLGYGSQDGVLVACISTFLVGLIGTIVSLIVIAAMFAVAKSDYMNHATIRQNYIIQLEKPVEERSATLYTDIAKWNADRKYTLELNGSPWLGAFNPDTYKDLEEIDIK